jgi:hypothetical protein
MSMPFLNILQLLAKHEVDFVIIGGFAGAVHGCTILTQDIDICCDFSVPNLLKLATALKDIHPVHRMTPARLPLKLNEANTGQFKNLYLDTDIGQLDCLSFVEGLGDYEKVKQGSILIEAEGLKMRTLDIDTLIKAKKAMNRPRDRQMIEELKKIKNAQK